MCPILGIKLLLCNVDKCSEMTTVETVEERIVCVLLTIAQGGQDLCSYWEPSSAGLMCGHNSRAAAEAACSTLQLHKFGMSFITKDNNYIALTEFDPSSLTSIPHV